MQTGPCHISVDPTIQELVWYHRIKERTKEKVETIGEKNEHLCLISMCSKYLYNQPLVWKAHIDFRT